MRTKLFCELIELAMQEVYGEGSEFDSVPYLPTHDGATKEICLGVFLLEDVHMAVVAAKAQHILYRRMTDENCEDADIDEAMGDFADLMGGMQVAPYMQWHCAYFPGLTAEQVLAEREGYDDPVDGSFVPSGPVMAFVPTPAIRKELTEMRAVDEITIDTRDLALRWLDSHAEDVLAYHNNGMSVREIADTICSLVNNG